MENKLNMAYPGYSDTENIQAFARVVLRPDNTWECLPSFDSNVIFHFHPGTNKLIKVELSNGN